MNRAVVLTHDAVGNREAEAGAAADGFRREERVVDARDLLGGDARPGVRDFRDDAIAFDARGDRQPAAARHRVARVEEEIEEDLLELMLDAEHVHHRRRELAPHLDAADLELVLEQREHVHDDGVEIHFGPFIGRRAGPGEVQQAVDDLRGAERLPFDLLEQDGPRIGRIGAFEKHLREAGDARERRVDLVRDARGQQTDRRHLLGDLELFFELHAVGDVLDDHQHPDDAIVAGGVLERHFGGVDQQTRRLAVARGQRHAIQRGAVRVVLPRGAQRLDKRRVEQIAEPAADRLVAGDAVELLERAVPADDLLVHVEHDESVVERLEDVLVELAHAAELLGLEVQLPVEAAVLDRGRDLAGHRRQQAEILAVERLVGLLAAERQETDEPFNSEDLGLLTAVAGQVATAIENGRLYRQLHLKAEELGRMREFNENILESLDNGLVVFDLDEKIVRWNRALEEFYGVAREAAIGRRLGDLFDAPFVEALRAARQDHPYGATLYRVPLSSRDSNTPRLLVNATEVPLQNTSGDDAVVGMLMIIEDITDRVQLEEQLQISEKMAAIGLLAAGVAHEVNTPLTGISSFTQMLLEGADPGDPRTVLLEKIERHTFRAAKIVSGLLNLSRPGTTSNERVDVDLNAVIMDVFSLLEHQFEVGSIKVRRELAPAMVNVLGIEHQLQQVFLNLFLNARDAMPSGGWLSVTTRVEDGRVIAEVSDRKSVV